MSPAAPASVPTRRRARPAALAATAAVLIGSLTAGCGVVATVKTVAANVEGNKSIIDTFTSGMQKSGTAAFEVTYTTTGSAPATIVYAARPPNELLFLDTPTDATSSPGIDLVVNASGEFSCSPISSVPARDGRTCRKLATAQASVQNSLISLYTPAHWVAFLQGLALAAGFAGDKVTRSRLTVNGFDMACVDLQAAGIPGTSMICTTTAGILGYVKVASESTVFEIRSYTPSPPGSIFELPRGAKVAPA